MGPTLITGETSDGFHTFNELYAHRRALTAALARSQSMDSWRSKNHHPDDSPIFEGFFIVGLHLSGIGMITYHYPLENWDDFSEISELDHGMKWDGAAPNDTITRLLEWAKR